MAVWVRTDLGFWRNSGKPHHSAIIVCIFGTGGNLLGAILTDPDIEDRELGRRLWTFVESTYPHTKIWQSESPSVAAKNHHLYERCVLVCCVPVMLTAIEFGEMTRSENLGRRRCMSACDQGNLIQSGRAYRSAADTCRKSTFAHTRFSPNQNASSSTWLRRRGQ